MGLYTPSYKQVRNGNMYDMNIEKSLCVAIKTERKKLYIQNSPSIRPPRRTSTRPPIRRSPRRTPTRLGDNAIRRP